MSEQNSFQVNAIQGSGPEADGQEREDYGRIRMQEQMLLQTVREGNLPAQARLAGEMDRWIGSSMLEQDSMERMRTSAIIFAAQVCRAAMEGGMDEEEAYTLEQRYIREIGTADSREELRPVVHMMYADYTGRVHRRKEQPELSRSVRKCIQYIEAHPDARIRAADLARETGCSEYYLTRRFREETGQSVTDYIKQTRIRLAKALLTNTDQSVQKIAEQLGFGSRNYFTRIFRDCTGQTPTEYRRKAET